MEIIREDYGKEGVFKAIEHDKKIGIMTYLWHGSNIIVIDHTEVSVQLEGRGIGKDLFAYVVHFARENNVKIVPLCPFVVALCKKDPSIKDVLVVIEQ